MNNKIFNGMIYLKRNIQKFIFLALLFILPILSLADVLAPVVTMTVNGNKIIFGQYVPINKGESVKVTWSAQNSDSCTPDPANWTQANNATSGSVTLSPQSTYCYSLNCFSPISSGQAKATVMEACFTVKTTATKTDTKTDSKTKTTPTKNNSDVPPTSGNGDIPPSSSVTIKNPIKAETVSGLIHDILVGVVKILSPVVVLAVIYCGFLFVAAQGNSEKLGTAKRSLMYTLIGAAILFGASGLAQLIVETVKAL